MAPLIENTRWGESFWEAILERNVANYALIAVLTSAVFSTLALLFVGCACGSATKKEKADGKGEKKIDDNAPKTKSELGGQAVEKKSLNLEKSGTALGKQSTMDKSAVKSQTKSGIVEEAKMAAPEPGAEVLKKSAVAPPTGSTAPPPPTTPAAKSLNMKKSAAGTGKSTASLKTAMPAPVEKNDLVDMFKMSVILKSRQVKLPDSKFPGPKKLPADKMDFVDTNNPAYQSLAELDDVFNNESGVGTQKSSSITAKIPASAGSSTDATTDSKTIGLISKKKTAKKRSKQEKKKKK